MLPTAVRLSKASRRPLTSKRGNKDYYKGTRQAFLPNGTRTGAPGKHVVGGKAKYRLIDEKVRVFVAPPLEQIINSPLKPYVAQNAHLSKNELNAVWGKFTSKRGVTPSLFLQKSREAFAELQATYPEGSAEEPLTAEPTSSSPDPGAPHKALHSPSAEAEPATQKSSFWSRA
ncbi:hypothetical protein BD626DRAFT_433118 [Schizophyllum amplum]|uniref:Mitochondrial ribosomal protein L27-domain-containing protein n=1 Tax=Schizophyllum amplum TaxID=97359 RepID=A0A550CBY0_9AGAR|nr:hypothetical protein BD626DRAFT_433118 [Auriculariopsis ampla]